MQDAALSKNAAVDSLLRQIDTLKGQVADLQSTASSDKQPAKSRSDKDKLPECYYIDPKSKATFPLDKPIWSGPDRAPLQLTDLPGIRRDQIIQSTRSLWRYSAAFPRACVDPITLGEGCTPLLARKFGAAGATVHFKCEWFNPTCSFKDRGTTVILSLLREQGI